MKKRILAVFDKASDELENLSGAGIFRKPLG